MVFIYKDRGSQKNYTKRLDQKLCNHNNKLFDHECINDRKNNTFGTYDSNCIVLFRKIVIIKVFSFLYLENEGCI